MLYLNEDICGNPVEVRMKAVVNTKKIGRFTLIEKLSYL